MNRDIVTTEDNPAYHDSSGSDYATGANAIPLGIRQTHFDVEDYNPDQIMSIMQVLSKRRHDVFMSKRKRDEDVTVPIIDEPDKRPKIDESATRVSNRIREQRGLLPISTPAVLPQPVWKM